MYKHEIFKHNHPKASHLYDEKTQKDKKKGQHIQLTLKILYYSWIDINGEDFICWYIK